LVLIVVAGAFVFSDLVMMKYLAFGLVTALVLDATVVRMFLVPSVMKLLGDECWWAPRWMKRLQNRLGLNEIDLPDERKPSAVPEPEEELEKAAVGADAPVPPLPHDPTHPAVEGSAQQVAEAARLAYMPSLVDTAPMPNVSTAGDGESPRISTAESPENGADGDATAPAQRTDGDGTDATTAIPARRQQDPDAT
jgi:hypothetical protein